MSSRCNLAWALVLPSTARTQMPQPSKPSAEWICAYVPSAPDVPGVSDVPAAPGVPQLLDDAPKLLTLLSRDIRAALQVLRFHFVEGLSADPQPPARGIRPVHLDRSLRRTAQFVGEPLAGDLEDQGPAEQPIRSCCQLFARQLWHFDADPPAFALAPQDHF